MTLVRPMSWLAPVFGTRAIWWLFVPVFASFVCLGAYVRAPGDREVVARVAPNLDGRSLLVFVHPGCPCTLASLEQLDRVLTRADDEELRVRVILYRPEDARRGFAGSDLEERVRSLPDVQVVDDPGGVIAARFGARTSGHALLFDKGRLLYDGGLTSARGHAGDSESSSILLDLLRRKEQAAKDARPVFGCSIRGEA